MKIMSLNIWGGHVQQPLLQFFEANQDVDVICLQEVYCKATQKMGLDDRAIHLDIFHAIQRVLSQHKGYFCPVVDYGFGIAIFVKNGLSVVSEGHVMIHDNPHYDGRGPLHPRKLQWLKCQAAESEFCVLNVHGLWNGKGKFDSEERLRQSQFIRQVMEELPRPQIVCGDFNLRPDTKSLQIVSEGMVNLIKDHGITDTRTELYEKTERYADYIFVSDEIQVNRFQVLPDVVSDHAALVLDFALPVTAEVSRR